MASMTGRRCKLGGVDWDARRSARSRAASPHGKADAACTGVSPWECSRRRLQAMERCESCGNTHNTHAGCKAEAIDSRSGTRDSEAGVGGGIRVLLRRQVRWVWGWTIDSTNALAEHTLRGWRERATWGLAERCVVESTRISCAYKRRYREREEKHNLSCRPPSLRRTEVNRT